MGRIDRATRFRLLDEAGFTCRYCGRQAPDVVLEIDHVHPKSKGGSNRRDNLVVACFDCNRGKRAQVLTAAPAPVRPMPTWVMDCTDACPQCYVDPAVRDWPDACLPVSVAWDGDGLAYRYRCRHGHDWSTWCAEGTARAVALEGMAEGVETYPRRRR